MAFDEPPVLLLPQNINVTDTMYNRVVKDICQSKGYHWMLKNGADM